MKYLLIEFPRLLTRFSLVVVVCLDCFVFYFFLVNHIRSDEQRAVELLARARYSCYIIYIDI